MAMEDDEWLECPWLERDFYTNKSLSRPSGLRASVARRDAKVSLRWNIRPACETRRGIPN
jgi:hypothetical protein